MKILNDISCKLDWIPIQQLDSNSIEEKWDDANWWKRYWRSPFEYGVEK